MHSCTYIYMYIHGTRYRCTRILPRCVMSRRKCMQRARKRWKKRRIINVNTARSLSGYLFVPVKNELAAKCLNYFKCCTMTMKLIFDFFFASRVLCEITLQSTVYFKYFHYCVSSLRRSCAKQRLTLQVEFRKSLPPTKCMISHGCIADFREF